MINPDDDLSYWPLERLRRKHAQAWHMATLAREDGDAEDEATRTAEAQSYEAEIQSRARQE